ncbi:MAG: hypothetical protein QG588_2400, partial [Candidatus Poribacteria bacterium]|nr:hypothetical protein [Candidatus Poribacteria bacterium]
MENHKFYSIGQVAQLLGVSDRTIRRLVWKGDLEAIKVGKSVRIASEYIEVYTSKNKFKNGEGQPKIKLSESEISLEGMFKDGKLIPEEDINKVWNDEEHPKKRRFSLRGRAKGGEPISEEDIDEVIKEWNIVE